ncbi:MAG: radical SAM protein [Chloroflexi bacterium HGW-Chloroflexi-5]|jgi:radical SAM/Cys-rich protein|nr:MAG: radical SAM protein [Deltaproteobacteria bacterium HGW-Deltaproteobacteria-12]PKN95990.1 MAG: radical SAM protein [Chloroflexi bacterium HGW-Chloroflexi-5]
MDASEQLKILGAIGPIPSFFEKIRENGKVPLAAKSIDILQINVGRVCNLACRHCHVNAGPDRRESMSRPVLEKCLEILGSFPISTIDITGGSPEMNPHFEWFVTEAARLNRRLIVRSNLTLLKEEPYRRLPKIFSENRVEVVTSLPDYLEGKSDRQRGAGVFRQVIEAMRELNRLGYGMEGSSLLLDIIHNPVGAYLPGSQTALEHEYRERLRAEHDVRFNQLFCLTNLPVGRYLEYLLASGNFEDYLSTLCHSFNLIAVDKVMCRTTLSVGWNGSLYDCDFNQMLDLKVDHGAPDHILNFDMQKLEKREIVINNHCYGCVAGAGSSCQGATTGV